MPDTEKKADETKRKLSDDEVRLEELGKRIDQAEAEIAPAKPKTDQGWEGDVA
jgi:hypothetical protein